MWMPSERARVGMYVAATIVLTVAGAVLAILAGCEQKPEAASKSAPPPARTVGVAVYADGELSIDQQAKLDFARGFWREQGIEIQFGEPKATPKNLLDVDNADNAEARRLGMAVVFARSVRWDGKSYGGLGFAGGPCIIAFFSHANVVSHEMGHAFGLEHRDSGCNLMKAASPCAASTIDADQRRAAIAWKSSARAREVGPFVCGGMQ